MKILLDAHAAIWHKTDDPRLSRTASDALENPRNELFISVVTFWELGIKESLGKLKIRGGVDDLHAEWIGSGAASLLQIEWKHLRRNLALPWLHRDPFDRLLISQALAEGMKLVTVDSEIRKYPGVQIVG